MTALSNRIVERYSSSKKAARTQGPYIDLKDFYIIYWMDLGELYGRVHNITEDLLKAEKLLLKIRDYAEDVLQQQLKLPVDIGDVYIDGLGGRNHMMASFTVSSYKGSWDVDKVGDALGLKYVVDYKKDPRNSR